MHKLYWRTSIKCAIAWVDIEADKTEFKIYRQPSLLDIITIPPSEICDHLQLLKNTPHASQMNMPITTEAKQ
jgi:hypothetical protein